MVCNFKFEVSIIEGKTNENKLRVKKAHKRVIKKQRQYKRLVSQIVRIIMLVIIALLLVCAGMKIKKETSVEYKKKSDVSYKVYLKDNEYYDEQYLDQDMKYIANLIDHLEVNFRSTFSIDELSDVRYKYSIDAYVNVTESTNDEKTLYSKTFTLIDNKTKSETGVRNISINENVKVNYQEYNEMVEAFKTSYGLSANSVLLLELKVEIDCKPSTFEKSFSDAYTSKIDIPLGSPTIDISIDKSNNDTAMTKTEYAQYDYSKYFYYVAIILIILAFILFRGMIKYTKRINENKKPYDDYINKLLREHGRAIIRINDCGIIEESTVIEVKTFEELINIHNSTKQPIACVEDFKEQDNEKTIFFIKYNGDIYRYTVEKKNFVNYI